MYHSAWFLTAALVGTTIALVQPVAAAKSGSEVETIAKAVSVEIKLQKNNSVGSGVIIDSLRFSKADGTQSPTGNLYTLVTNRHVVCGNQSCAKLPASESYSLKLSDGQQYRVTASDIKLLGNDLDLAIIQFRSNRNYAVAKMAPPGSLKNEDQVYTAGFPFEKPGFTFGTGNALAVVNKRLKGDSGGYTIVYDALTLPGMSGGGVFNSSGQLVAIHGMGDRVRENTLAISDGSQIGTKVGLNRGIPVRWLVQNLAELGINLGIARNLSSIRVARAQVPATADEYFIAGVNKFIEPGNNAVAGRKQAIQEFSTALRLNPKYQYAYFARAFLYIQIKEFKKSLPDFDQFILLNPKYSEAYYGRAVVKLLLNDAQGSLADLNQVLLIKPQYAEAYYFRGVLKYKLNDSQGGLADLNQAILLNPKSPEVYYYRALLKKEKLNDSQGALADCNQAILLNPKYSEAYTIRAFLRYEKQNDLPGAMADLNQAILFNPKYSEAYMIRGALKYAKQNDRTGGIQDVRQAARLAREQGNTQALELATQALKQMSATE
jgi:tetratricopeptide (TPR) repeat protein/S1-C subfamily serine protease